MTQSGRLLPESGQNNLIDSIFIDTLLIRDMTAE